MFAEHVCAAAGRERTPVLSVCVLQCASFKNVVLMLLYGSPLARVLPVEIVEQVSVESDLEAKTVEVVGNGGPFEVLYVLCVPTRVLLLLCGRPRTLFSRETLCCRTMWKGLCRRERWPPCLQTSSVCLGGCCLWHGKICCAESCLV